MLQAYKTEFPRESSWDDNTIVLPLTKETALPLILDMLESKHYITEHGDSAFYYLQTGFFSRIPDGERRYHRMALAEGLRVFLVESGIPCEMQPKIAESASLLRYPGWMRMHPSDLTDNGRDYYYGGRHSLLISNLSRNQFINKLDNLYSASELASRPPKPPHKNDCCALI